MELKKINDKPDLNENFPGKQNKWELIEGNQLKLIDYYPNFRNDLEQALNALENNNSISKTICNKIRNDISKGIIRYETYGRFSKWCDWNQESSMILAKNISRILFGFDMPRIWTQENKLKNKEILNNFLSNFTDEKKETYNDNLDKIDNNETAEKITLEISREYEKLRKDGRIEFITFHPAYSYEEFIEGITVKIEKEGKATQQVKYMLKPGIFKNLCKRALGSAIGYTNEEMKSKTWQDIYNDYQKRKDTVDFDEASKFVLIIDEINRGDMAKIFGELITLIEVDKRLGAENELIVKLPTSGDDFSVPKNVYIIATMNTADRSIALLDVALRRRFGFIEMNPNFDILKEEHINRNEARLKENGAYDLLLKSINCVQKINEKICDDPSVGRDRQIGHSFLFKVLSYEDLVMVWKHEIFPLLEEYFYSDYKKINKILFDKDTDTEWITTSKGIQDIDKNNIERMLDSIK